LIFAAAAALLCANSPLGDYYVEFLNIPGSVQIGSLEIAKPMLLWINDLWMAVFFFLIGLEIKREFLEGELSTRADLMLPTAAAVGGMAVPALIYVVLNRDSPVNLNGWAIPTATDIAFALGILALVGSRAPLSLKVLLTAIAIIDDLGAILVIAIFYTANISVVSLGLAGLAILGLILLNIFRVTHVAAYLVVGTVLWVCVLKSGVHATLAGVVTAFAIPLRVEDEDGHSLLKHLEHSLHPWVAFMILPMFAFANAGISFEGINLGSFLEPVTLGITLGLIAGKQLGVFLPIWLCIKSGIAPMPKDTTWVQLYAVSLLCGIGFTMSLFIGGLAFELSDFKAPVRLGVLTGSIVSAVLGYALLRFFAEKSARQTPS
jgi:NhaA family Na+:H+ antiporter